MSNTLTLNASGNGGCTPDQDPWTPTKGANVSIYNGSGAHQNLTNFTNGCLVTQAGGTVTSISLDNAQTWQGKAGSARGTYTYDDGLADLGTRNGTIDPS